MKKKILLFLSAVLLLSLTLAVAISAAASESDFLATPEKELILGKDFDEVIQSQLTGEENGRIGTVIPVQLERTQCQPVQREDNTDQRGNQQTPLDIRTGKVTDNIVS